jgi:uncharacterized Tic20 family protein
MTAPEPAPRADALSETEDRQWAGFANFGNILGLLPAVIIWLVFKDRGAKTRVEGKEALNWIINISGLILGLWIVYIVLQVVAFAAPSVGIIAFIVGLLMFAVYVVNVIFAILAGIAVYRGGSYRYPYNIRWIK